jgi:diguanylate cyclase (GGDEF)-like protein
MGTQRKVGLASGALCGFMNTFSYPDTRGFDLRSYERLADLLPRLLAEETLDCLLESIADIVEELVPCSAILIYHVRSADGALVPLLSRGLLSDGGPIAGDSPRRGLESLAIASVGALRPGQRGVRRASEVDQGASAVEAMAAIPLVVRGEPVGCLALRRRGVGQLFGDDELRFIERLSDVAAITLDNARARAALAELAQTDALTGVLNRRGFLVAFDRTLAQAARSHCETSVLTVDVDDLKSINDRFGHSVGDDVLVCVAETLKGRTRRGDVVGRLGGDEFAVVLAKATFDQATEIRIELEDLLRDARVGPRGREIAPTASFGTASTRASDMSAQQLLAQSDTDMYEMKSLRKQDGTVGILRN